jgi:hypothetical protein
MVFYTVTNGVMQMVEADGPAAEQLQTSNKSSTSQNLVANAGYTQPSIYDEDVRLITPGTVEDTRLIHEDLPGPRYVCMPKWPSFMSSQIDQVSILLDPILYRLNLFI